MGSGPDEHEILAGYRGISGLAMTSLGNRADVLDILQAADLFVFPSLHENLSIALLEAMASQLPVIATAVGGNVEVLEHGGGVLVPPRDVDALADAISELAQSPSERHSLARAARARVEGHYTLRHMLDRLYATYEQILDSRRPK